ncbi:MAG TPA: glycosyltransferase family 1 protein [Aggregatilinea sp.]|uniref:glycosyltransferase family 4 protein n=1 Tax=Aggregatilinea sp. TaxID=2806333 RepID=UPI002CD79C89|nr:glycosyltransferase family 1 protein [Aggregatilinea sp.]HML23081.1 glycosyltransferase family 1 protein [Aggregatilinea sp.]
MPALTIAIDASRTTTARRTGTENYALQLIRALIALDSPHHFHLYFRDQPPDDLFPAQPNVTLHVIPWPRAWTHTRFAAALWRARPDVTFVPAHTLPLVFPGRGVVTVHDLGYLYFPSAHPPRARRYLEWTTRFSARRAARVLVDSLATARDLAAHYDIPDHRITLVYPGLDDTLARVTDPATLAGMRARYGLPERYLLFLGTLQPRKNIARIVQAYAQWRTQSGVTDIALVLGGSPGWLYDPAWTQGVDGVIETGYVRDEDVAALYSGALALVFPTLYEGFGFPVLEAMRCGVPVIASNTSSLPEVAGNAALLVNPRGTDAIQAAIAQIVTDSTLRHTLVARGVKQAQRFTWQNAAAAALHALEQAAGTSP